MHTSDIRARALDGEKEAKFERDNNKQTKKQRERDEENFSAVVSCFKVAILISVHFHTLHCHTKHTHTNHTHTAHAYTTLQI